MNKKILFAALSIAALTACSTDEFESQNVAEGTTSPVQFEVINNQFDNLTRASMSGNKIKWSAKDGDLFTLYHGAGLGALTGYENATYTAQEGKAGSPATLTTPSMILQGGAVMVWPVDSTFRITSADALTITIPAVQTNVEDNIPYMSDLVNIAGYTGKDYDKNTAGLNRKYPVYMRPMASQLKIKADYAGTDETIATLYKGDDPIDSIRVTSVDLSTKAGGTTLFTTEIPVQFQDPTVAPYAGVKAQWDAKVSDNAWNKIVDFDLTGALVKSNILTATDKSVTGNDSCKILLLPQVDINTATGGLGVEEGAVVVNTIYGSVVVAPNSVTVNGLTGKYSSGLTGELSDAWYRYIQPATAEETYEAKAAAAETSGDNIGKHKTTTNVMQGMMQTIDAFSKATSSEDVIKGEPVGAASTRYVKVLLTHLDMTNLHIENDKQLRDAARVWQKLGLDGVTVRLDGDATTGEFAMSQKTIETINNINDGIAADADKFKVMPCEVAVAGHTCTTIVITDNDANQDIQDITFIRANTVTGTAADIAFADEAKAWKWNDVVLINATTDVNTFINRGEMENAKTATLNVGTPGTPFTAVNVELINDGEWNITAGTLNVQFDVTNNGKVNISDGAQYRQDNGAGFTPVATFTNEATAIPGKFEGGDDTQIGLVVNEGVFACVANGVINNYGLIKHDNPKAKTYITTNQIGGTFTNSFTAVNKMGRINLPYSNKNEDNISVSADLSEGFVSVTVTKEDLEADGITDGILNLASVGNKVNYVIINSGVNTISGVANQIKYLEIADKDKNEIAWAVEGQKIYKGLMVLTPVNIKLNSRISLYDGTTPGTGACYLGADMYVGGEFDNGTTNTRPVALWQGYFGDTSDEVATKYITY